MEFGLRTRLPNQGAAEGREHRRAKRMRSFEGQTAPFKIQYRYRPQEYGDQLVRMYLLTNDKESTLGTTPLAKTVAFWQT